MARTVQHYQTSFTMTAREGQVAKLYRDIQYVIYSWIVDKEKKMWPYGARCIVRAKDFFQKVECKQAHSFVKTITYVSPDKSTWAMRYQHDHSVIDSIAWSTEIGVRADFATGKIVFSMLLTRRTHAEVILDDPSRDVFPPSVPTCLREMLKLDSLEGISMRGIQIPMSGSGVMHVHDTKDIDCLLEIIRNPERKFVVVLVMGASESCKKESNRIARGIAGKSLVALVDYNQHVVRSLAPYKTNFEEVRVLLPFRKAETMRSLSRHPKYSILSEGADEMRKRLIESQCCYAEVAERNALWRYEDVAGLIRESCSRKRVEQVSTRLANEISTNADVRELFDAAMEDSAKVSTLTEENKNLKDDIEALKTKIDEIKNDCNSKLFNCQQRYFGEARRKHDRATMPRELPTTLSALKKWSTQFANLKIAAKAWDGMCSRRGEDFVMIAWDMLWCLDNVVHQVYGESISGNPKDLIEERTGYSFSSTESDTTKGNEDWVRERTVVVEDKTYQCFKHLKKGIGAASAMRLYFEYDPNIAKIIVAHIGDHLSTKRTSHT